jgi:two-component system chemotaxis response regulator CheY
VTTAGASAPHPILVVEDDADVRECLADILSGEGYFVHTAADGRDALGALERIPQPCVVLLDLMMPGMNGWDFLEAIRQTPALSDLPVVIVSAYQGPSGFPVLHKPVDLDELLRVVARYCDRA